MVWILYGKTYKNRMRNIPTKILDPYNMLFVGWNFSFQRRNKKAPAFAGAFVSPLNLQVLADFHFDLFWLRFLGLGNRDGEDAVGVVGSDFLAVHRIG